MSAGVRKLAIGALSPDINNSLVVGVIIAKQSLRLFVSSKDGKERGVWNFTLRDSAVDTINITFWGSAEAAKQTSEAFMLGDVVEIMNARVLFKQPNSSDAEYSPSVSSPFQLQLQENSSTLLPYNGQDASIIQRLASIPTKPASDFLRLSDLISYGEAMRGDYVNLLVAVRNVGEVRNVKSRKDSRDIPCRDVLVMDQSNLEFQITLWSEEGVRRANYWRARKTVIFFADIKIDWNEFRQTVTAVPTSRTIITENPNTAEANALVKYAQTFPLQPIAILDHLTKSVADPSSITTIMTTAQIVERAWKNDSVDNRFTALLYAVVTCLDIDGKLENAISYKCATCHQFLDETVKCLNSECLIITKGQFNIPVPIYDLKVNLSDHRGSVLNCRVLSPAADEILGCPVARYMTMSQSEKTEIKWRLLLSRCEIRMLILCTSKERPYPLYSVLTCKKSSPAEVSSKLPIY